MFQSTRHRFRPGLEGFESRELLSSISPSVATMKGPAVAAVSGVAGDFNRTRFPAERRDLSPGEFPRLGRDYEVIAPFSDRYNCIAHSLGVQNRWISPRTGPARNPFAWADKTYAEKGYTRLPAKDTDLDPGVRKVVLYGSVNRDGSVKKVLHAALQRADGTWTSKMGRGGLIRHPTPGSVAGGMYGRPIAVYARVA